MKRKSITLLATLFLLSTIFTFGVSASSSSEEESAKQSVINYIEAINTENPSEIVKWVEDIRFESTEDQIKQYEFLFTESNYSNYQLTEMNQNGQDFKAKIKLDFKDNTESVFVDIPVRKVNNVWKLIVEGQEVRTNETISKISTPEIISKSDVQPFADVAYWKMSLGITDYSTTSFNMTGRSVNIIGWQEVLGTQSEPTVSYQIVKKGFLTDDVLGETIIQGIYTQNGTRYNDSISTAMSGNTGVHVKVVNYSALGKPATAAGNAYQ